MIIKKRSDGSMKMVEGSDSGEPYMILCGVTASGEIKPIRVDDLGQIILSA